MTPFDLEMKIFKEIIPKYKPIKGHHLVLDLADYKLGKETIHKYKVGCKKYHDYVNIECNEKNIEIVIITSNTKNRTTYCSKYLYANFSHDQEEFIEIADLTPPIRQLKRTMQQEIELLCFRLHNPEPIKPDC